MYLISNNILAEDNAIIEIIPEAPEPESDIEIKAFIDMEGIEQVYIIIQECDINTGICYERKNISLNKISDNTYSNSYKLKESKATYIQYNLLVKSDTGWETLIQEEKTNLLDTKNNGDVNGNEDTPGFEIIASLLAIISIILLLNKRKR
jgi:hypothetical protein